MGLHWLLPVILLTAMLFGALARRAKLPAVVGHLLAGVFLGPAVLGLVTDGTHGESGSALPELAQIGLCVLLFRIGLETRLDDARRVARPAFLLAAFGMLAPLLLGTLATLFAGLPVIPAVFVGATLTATSIGVTASVLEEIGAGATHTTTLILGAAVVDDVLGLVLLAALIGLGQSSTNVPMEVVAAVARAAAFLVFALLAGRSIARASLWLTRWTGARTSLLVLVFSALLLTAAAAEASGLEMIIGAYAAGVALARHPEREWITSELEPLIELFTPVFFVLVGTSISFEALTWATAEGRTMLGLAGLLTVAAVIGKLAAPYLVRGLEAPRLAVGSALVPRGEVGLIFAQVGLVERILAPDLFSALVLVITATTLLGPALLRATWSRDTT